MLPPLPPLCSHCGLPVPAGLVDPDAEVQFCCHGCRAVYEVIHGCGLGRFYRLRESADAAGRPAVTSDRKYGEFDDAVFRGLYCRTLPDGTQSVEFYLEGVHCAACVWLVEKLPQVLPGVVEARLELRRALVRVRWDDARVPLSRVARTLDSLGYPPHPAKDARSRQLRREEDRRFLIRIGVAGACAGNVMTLAFALYGGVFTGIEAPLSNFFRAWSMIWGLVALAWPGSLFFRGAWAALRTRTAHLDLPIALGLVAGGLAGSINAVRGRGEIYFDSLTMLIFLLLVGRWLQRRQQCWTNDALELLFSVAPTSARRVEGDAVVEVPLEAVQPGDLLEVRAGDSIPADGTVDEGRSAVNQALLTGEPEAVAVGPGEAVHAGTVNLSARLLIRAVSVGAETRIGRLMQLVEAESRSRAPIVQYADRVAGYFVRGVLLAAAATLGLWLWRDPSRAIDHAVALLIVTCPCALGLATPLAVSVALGRAARRHILVKGGEALELLGRRGVLFLDKTGTLTLGRTSIASWAGDVSIRPLVAALERHSSHPIAQALVTATGSLPGATGSLPGATGSLPARAAISRADKPPVAPDSNPSADSLTATSVEQTLGGGIVGTVDGRCVVVGSPRFVREHGASVDAAMQAAEEQTIAAGATPVLAAVDGRTRAVIGLADPIRDDVHEALASLRTLGWQIGILSGDHPDVVAAMGRRLGIDPARALGGLSPEDKVDQVRRAAAQGPVLMVGDGVNDAAALSAASVGIAVHGGAEASLAAAHVYLGRPGLMPVVELMDAARRTLRAIHRCLAASLGYNAIAASLAIAGLIGPLAAAILMPLSSFTVLALAHAARTFGERP